MTGAGLFAILEAIRDHAAQMSWPEALGYVGAILSISANSMRTMIPLRCVGILTNCTFITYGFLCAVYPTLIVNLVVLPINALRLRQMLGLVRQVRRAAASDLSMDWLKTFMSRRPVERGAVLFAKGDAAACMYYVLDGRLRLRETGLELGPGAVVGEMGFLSPDNRRTQTLECVETGVLLSIGYDELRQLYFQNPAFGFYFLRLTSGRLFQNMSALEAEVARLRAAQPLERAA
jgi:CRP/FNR family transcriptional regulator, cyclic AMP receptor protein